MQQRSDGHSNEQSDRTAIDAPRLSQEEASQSRWHPPQLNGCECGCAREAENLPCVARGRDFAAEVADDPTGALDQLAIRRKDAALKIDVVFKADAAMPAHRRRQGDDFHLEARDSE